MILQIYLQYIETVNRSLDKSKMIRNARVNGFMVNGLMD